MNTETAVKRYVCIVKAVTALKFVKALLGLAHQNTSKTEGSIMKNVLHIYATDRALATGLFPPRESSSENAEYNMYLPSSDCDMKVWLTQIDTIFQRVCWVSLDYVTIHEGDYSSLAITGMKINLSNLLFREGSRINIPSNLLVKML